mmetsp:Transcript_63523/g.129441  ORF Transcript_63523/g.129441 Transcript_63523/m.129441 type:complete len:97 (-) Transcript_63523:580-870(-)
MGSTMHFSIITRKHFTKCSMCMRSNRNINSSNKNLFTKYSKCMGSTRPINSSNENHFTKCMGIARYINSRNGSRNIINSSNKLSINQSLKSRCSNK